MATDATQSHPRMRLLDRALGGGLCPDGASAITTAKALAMIQARDFYYVSVCYGNPLRFMHAVVLGTGKARARVFADELASELDGRVVGVYPRGRYVREARALIALGVEPVIA